MFPHQTLLEAGGWKYFFGHTSLAWTLVVVPWTSRRKKLSQENLDKTMKSEWSCSSKCCADYLAAPWSILLIAKVSKLLFVLLTRRPWCLKIDQLHPVERWWLPHIVFGSCGSMDFHRPRVNEAKVPAVARSSFGIVGMGHLVSQSSGMRKQIHCHAITYFLTMQRFWDLLRELGHKFQNISIVKVSCYFQKFEPEFMAGVIFFLDTTSGDKTTIIPLQNAAFMFFKTWHACGVKKSLSPGKAGVAMFHGLFFLTSISKPLHEVWLGPLLSQVVQRTRKPTMAACIMIFFTMGPNDFLKIFKCK